jgi:hypothetical protein
VIDKLVKTSNVFTRVAHRRVTKKLACFTDSATFGDPVTVELNWGLRGVRNRCRCANHIPSTMTGVTDHFSEVVRELKECGDKVCVTSFNDGKGHAAQVVTT